MNEGTDFFERYISLKNYLFKENSEKIKDQWNTTQTICFFKYKKKELGKHFQNQSMYEITSEKFWREFSKKQRKISPAPNFWRGLLTISSK